MLVDDNLISIGMECTIKRPPLKLIKLVNPLSSPNIKQTSIVSDQIIRWMKTGLIFQVMQAYVFECSDTMASLQIQNLQ